MNFISNEFKIEYKNSKQFTLDLNSCREHWIKNNDIKLISNTEINLNIDEIDRVPTGIFQITVNNTIFDCMFHPGYDEYLHVFLNGKTKKPGEFQRWSWEPSSNVLCIADPTVKKYNLSLGWYYGNRYENYREYTSKIIISIAKSLSIPNDRIIIYGSSGGGTASIHISSYIDNSTSVSINPQTDITTLDPLFKKLEKNANIDYHNDEYKRNDMIWHINKNKSVDHLIIVNYKSKNDIQGLVNISNFTDLNLKYGITKSNNVTAWIYDADAIVSLSNTINHHVSVDYPELYLFINFIAKSLKNNEKKISICIEEICIGINELWFAYYKKYHELVCEQMLSHQYYNTALMYYEGNLIEKNDIESNKWLNLAINHSKVVTKNDALGIVNLALNNHLENNLENLFLLAKKFQKEPKMQIYLIRMYRDGIGVEKDLAIAIDLMRKIADKGSRKIKREFIDLLICHGETKDLQEAFNQTKKYASSDPAFYSRLSKMYRDGIGVEKNLNMAIECMKQAVIFGSKKAEKELKNMEKSKKQNE